MPADEKRKPKGGGDVYPGANPNQGVMGGAEGRGKGAPRAVYAKRFLRGTGHQRMHRVIMGKPPFSKAEVDHINGDGLDNRRSNLRWATKSENQWNQRSPVGAYFNYGKWQAVIKQHGRRKSLGAYATKEEAQRAYRKARAERNRGMDDWRSE